MSSLSFLLALLVQYLGQGPPLIIGQLAVIDQKVHQGAVRAVERLVDQGLQGASPVIDMGDNNAPSLPEFDLDGNARIDGEAVDMGTYEYISDTVEDDEIIGSSGGCSISALPAIGFLLLVPAMFLSGRGK